jgi:cyclohexadieny/prephenate dehydrogenase
MKVFDAVAIIGLGLIGSSLTRAIQAKGLAGKVLGFDGSDAVRARY